MQSHYSRRSTSRLYLEENLTLPKMYELYKEKMANDGKQAIKMHKYREVFNCENLSFHKPTRDACRFCIRFKKIENPSDADKTEQEAHIIRKEQARKHKQLDKEEAIGDDNCRCVCFDIEQVLPVPCSNVSTLFYKRKLSCYNLTVYDMKTRDAVAYLGFSKGGGVKPGGMGDGSLPAGSGAEPQRPATFCDSERNFEHVLLTGIIIIHQMRCN